MATEKRNGRIALLCDDCREEIWADVNMVMINDQLWEEISDNTEDAYCDNCMEERMGRPIEIEDFKEPSIPGIPMIPCNTFWLHEQRAKGRKF